MSHLSHFSQQFLFSQNFHQRHFLGQSQPRLQSLHAGSHGQSATGQAGLQGTITCSQGQGATAGQHGLAHGFEQGQAAKDWVPINIVAKIPNDTNNFFMVNSPFILFSS